MPKITVEEARNIETLPADSILHLKVEDVQVKDVNGRNGSWQKLEFKFKVLGIQAIGDGSNPSAYEDIITQFIWGSVPFRLDDSPENKLRLWAEAILGMELGIGYELDTDLFLRREVRGVTSLYDKRATNPKTGRPFQGHQVDSLLPKAQHATQPANPWAQSMQPPAQQQAPVQQAPAQQQAAPAAGDWGAPAQPAQNPWAGQQQSWEEPPF